jgi:hypothetical protein
METKQNNMDLRIKGEHMNYIIGAFLAAILGILISTRPTSKDIWDDGYKVGMKAALKTNPPSDELEMTCAGLWVGEQNKQKYQKGLK